MKLAKAMSMALACAMAATMCATSAFAATSGSTTDNYGLSAVLTPGVWEGTATFSCALA